MALKSANSESPRWLSTAITVALRNANIQFRAMLALEAGDDADEPLSDVDADPQLADTPSKIEVAFIGDVAVDSGQLMVTDPCYIDADWRREPFSVAGRVESTEDTLFNYSYDGACRATLSGGGHGELPFELGPRVPVLHSPPRGATACIRCTPRSTMAGSFGCPST